MTHKITSPSNSLIKHVKSLHKKKGRWKTHSFFIEGTRAVEESLNSNAEIDFILYSDSLLEVKGGKELINKANKKCKNVYNITEELLYEISDTETPQGVLGVINFSLSPLDDILLEERNFLVILDEVRDPGNMGTIIRTADALGSNGIIITKGCVDVFNPKTIRSTMGSIFHIPLIFENDIEDVIIKLRKKHVKIISTTLNAEKFCYDIDFSSDFAIVIGNEAAGVSGTVIELSDYTTKIPMIGKAESLNAAIASGIIMYEASRQRLNFN